MKLCFGLIIQPFHQKRNIRLCSGTTLINPPCHMVQLYRKLRSPWKSVSKVYLKPGISPNAYPAVEQSVVLQYYMNIKCIINLKITWGKSPNLFGAHGWHPPNQTNKFYQEFLSNSLSFFCIFSRLPSLIPCLISFDLSAIRANFE